MDKIQWQDQGLATLYTNSQDYTERALYIYANELLKEQRERLEIMAGELDGTLWSPGNWYE